MQEYFEVGEIVNTHGVKGEVKIIPLTDDPERYEHLDWVYIDKDKKLIKYEIEDIKYIKSLVIVKFKGINDMSSAEALKGCFLKVDRENAVKLPKDSYFISDLIDCTVFDIEGNTLGVVTEILKTGSNDVYVVKGTTNSEILIPALKSVVHEINIEGKKIVVELPEGLI